MMTSLRMKLTIALLVTGLSGVLIIAVLVRAITVNEFDNYLSEKQLTDIVASMAEFYEIFGSWEEVAAVRMPTPPENAENPAENPAEILLENPAETPPENAENPVESGGQPAARPPNNMPVQYALFDVDGNRIIPRQNTPPNSEQPPGTDMSPFPLELDMEKAEPVIVDGETVGYIVIAEGPPGRDMQGEAYLKRFNQLIVAATGGAIAVALLMSFTFARSLSQPLHEITDAIKSVAHGNLEQQIPVRSRDEIGQVAAAFNQMSTKLAHANQLRRQMTADIAHELRTPLVVIVGYLASLSEGLLSPSPERFKIMHEEAVHLQRLVDDLRTLSLADAGELSLNIHEISARELLNRTIAAFSQRAEQQSITLSVQADPDLLMLQADPDRILQVLSNLVSNALRYTPQNGTITLTSHIEDKYIELGVRDTGSGIKPEHLPFVFERFYRIDSSRHEEQSESGLGLAIAKSIVEAHGGTITVSSEIGTGTTFTISLPVKKHFQDKQA